jgi:hypothetical protein
MSHTPGPWVIVTAEDGTVESIRVEEWKRNNLMGDFRGSIICDLSASHGGRPHAYKEAEANARLIAAAPELLAENQRIREALQYYAEGAWPVNAKGLGGGCLSKDQTGEPDYGQVARAALQMNRRLRLLLNELKGA